MGARACSRLSGMEPRCYRARRQADRIPQVGQPRTLALELARRPAGWAAAVALLGLGLLGGVVPLLDVPGFELGLAGAWVGLLLAGTLGLAAARAERARP